MKTTPDQKPYILEWNAPIHNFGTPLMNEEIAAIPLSFLKTVVGLAVSRTPNQVAAEIEGKFAFLRSKKDLTAEEVKEAISSVFNEVLIIEQAEVFFKERSIEKNITNYSVHTT